jgi:TatD DNase family protein
MGNRAARALERQPLFDAAATREAPVTARATRFIDTHAHFDVFAAEHAVPDVLARAAAAGVDRVLAVGGTPAANALALDLARAYPQRLRAAVGFDRDEILARHDEALLRAQAEEPLCVAVGETGLDYHYGPDTRDAQCALFERMLGLAAAVRKPVVVHSRDAEADTLALLRAHCARPGVDTARPGVLHCFTGSFEFGRRAADLGYFVSFSGIVTFKNAAALREVARAVPAERLLVETDAPYLAPVPHRGRRNEPAWVVEVCAALAVARGVSLEQMADQVWNNARTLFAWHE